MSDIELSEIVLDALSIVGTMTIIIILAFVIFTGIYSIQDAIEKKKYEKLKSKTDYEEGYNKGRAEARAEIHTALIDEMAMLNEAGLTENNLKTFAYRVKDIVEQLEVKYEDVEKRRTIGSSIRGT